MLTAARVPTIMAHVDSPRPCSPILVAHLMRPLEERLLQLLRSLDAAEWELQTIAPRWKVRDVVAHLMDTHLRKLSIVRDNHLPESLSISCDADLVDFVNRLNSEGVEFFRRFSPALLISMMEVASRESCDFHESLDPFAPARFGVSWAGEMESLNWFDTARELTERWHHQQQIRTATSRPGIEVPEFYSPVLDCFMRGVPHAFREVTAPVGVSVRIDIAGPSGGTWSVFRSKSGWMLTRDELASPAACVAIDESLAWKLFTKAVSPQEARKACSIKGDESLAVVFLHHRAIVG